VSSGNCNTAATVCPIGGLTCSSTTKATTCKDGFYNNYADAQNCISCG